MKYKLDQQEVKDALFQHLRKNMSAEEEVMYIQSEAKISVEFHHLNPPKLVLEIIPRSTN